MALNSVVGMCIAIQIVMQVLLLYCILQVWNANVPTPTRLNRSCDHSPSVPRHGAFGSGPLFGAMAPFMALIGRRSVDTSSVDCCRYPHLRYRLKAMSNFEERYLKVYPRVDLARNLGSFHQEMR